MIVDAAPEGGAIRRANHAVILSAAETVFSRRGFDGARMAEIADAAGLPKANLHYYFGTKDRLYAAVLESIVREWLDAADAWITADRDPAQALAGYVAAKLDHARRRPAASRIFAGELLRGAPNLAGFLAGEQRARVGRMRDVITGWASAGRMDPIDPTHLLFAIWAMTQTYADFDVQIRAALDDDADTVFATAVRTVTALVLKGSGVRAA